MLYSMGGSRASGGLGADGLHLRPMRKRRRRALLRVACFAARGPPHASRPRVGVAQPRACSRCSTRAGPSRDASPERAFLALLRGVLPSRGSMQADIGCARRWRSLGHEMHSCIPTVAHAAGAQQPWQPLAQKARPRLASAHFGYARIQVHKPPRRGHKLRRGSRRTSASEKK